MDAERHFDFIRTTEVKNLHSQVKQLVAQAKKVASQELQWRRKQLKELLDSEREVLEEEYGQRLKAAAAQGIAERDLALAMNKAENRRKEAEFLEAKRVHQHMTSCYDIRQALRRKDHLEMQKCRLFQIAEHDRQTAKKQESGKYWLAVTREHDRRTEARFRSEDCLRKELAMQTHRVLVQQISDNQRRREMKNKGFLVERAALAIANEAQALKDAKEALKPRTGGKYAQELRQVIAERAAIKRFEDNSRAEEHRCMVRQLQCLEAADNAAARQRKLALRQATIDFIEYSRLRRHFEKNAQAQRDKRIDELHQVDICTKNNLQRELQVRTEAAKKAHAILKQQVCDQYERRLREELERRENKMLENRFVPEEATRAEIMEQRREMREALDRQIVEMRHYQEMQEKRYESELMRAVDDPEYCKAFMERYMRDGANYLPPHPNWGVIGCSMFNSKGEETGYDAYKMCKEEAEANARGDLCLLQSKCPEKRRTLEFGLPDLNKYSPI